MLVFCDTSAFYAVGNPHDAAHAEAAEIWTALVRSDRHSLVTTNYIVIETIALVQRRQGLGAVRRLTDALDQTVDIAFVDSALHDAALIECLRSRRNVSLVDHVTFAFMRRHAIRFAFCFDSHFAEHGFEHVAADHV